MLPKTQRLDRKQFTAFFKQGRRVHGACSTIIYTPGPTLKASVVVSKKVYPKAHDRNSLRRRVYALLREQMAQNNLKGTLVILIKPQVKTMTRQQIKQQLTTEIEALALIR